jgi:hypothetical protein
MNTFSKVKIFSLVTVLGVFITFSADVSACNIQTAIAEIQQGGHHCANWPYEEDDPESIQHECSMCVIALKILCGRQHRNTPLTRAEERTLANYCHRLPQ